MSSLELTYLCHRLTKPLLHLGVALKSFRLIVSDASVSPLLPKPELLSSVYQNFS